MPTARRKGPLTEHLDDVEYASLSGYESLGGYAAARRALTDGEPDAILEAIEAVALTSRGGPRGPVAERWRRVRDAGRSAGSLQLVCDAGECQPGSFRDTVLMEHSPHRVLEGLLLCARAIGARRSFIFVRGEHAAAARSLTRAIDEATAVGYLGERSFGSAFAHEIVVFRSGGGQVSGEPSAILEALEGRKGLPRPRPEPEQAGLYGEPTLVQDVETLCQLPLILERGAEAYRALGTDGTSGTTLYGVSGHVVRPGLYELPLGTSLDEIVFEHAGGIAGGLKLKGVLPGGISTPILPAGQLDVAMSEAALREKGSALGCGGIIVMHERTCMVAVGTAIAEHYHAESCGQCGPCREGTAWLHEVLERIESGRGARADLGLLLDLCAKLDGQGICGLASDASRPIAALMRHFRDDFEAHLDAPACPFDDPFGASALDTEVEVQ